MIVLMKEYECQYLHQSKWNAGLNTHTVYVQYFTEAIIELVKVNAFLILQINPDSKNLTPREKFNIIVYSN